MGGPERSRSAENHQVVGRTPSGVRSGREVFEAGRCRVASQHNGSDGDRGGVKRARYRRVSMVDSVQQSRGTSSRELSRAESHVRETAPEGEADRRVRRAGWLCRSRSPEELTGESRKATRGFVLFLGCPGTLEPLSRP
jgi:hypothetical protein